MRTQTVALLSVLSLAVLAACSTAQDDSESAESAQTDEDAARGALRVLGAKIQNEDRTDATCRSCHDPNKLTLKKWSDNYKKTMAFISDEAKSVDERINFMRRNPEDAASSFATCHGARAEATATSAGHSVRCTSVTFFDSSLAKSTSS